MKIIIIIIIIIIEPWNIVASVHYLDIGLLVVYKGFSLISLGDKQLLGDLWIILLNN